MPRSCIRRAAEFSRAAPVASCSMSRRRCEDKAVGEGGDVPLGSQARPTNSEGTQAHHARWRAVGVPTYAQLGVCVDGCVCPSVALRGIEWHAHLNMGRNPLAPSTIVCRACRRPRLRPREQCKAAIDATHTPCLWSAGQHCLTSPARGCERAGASLFDGLMC